MSIQGNGHEHEFEAAYGLPEPLPAGENIVWQGAPDFRNLCVHVFHMRKVIGYFALLISIRGFLLYSSDASMASVAVGMLAVTGLALTAVAALGILAWLTARTTAYTLTDQRVVMRIGIVLTLTFNLPLKRIETAGLLLTGKGCGDIPLAIASGDRIGWINLWPHARPWCIARPEPMLRCIPQAQAFASTLQKTWHQANDKAGVARQIHKTVEVTSWQKSSPAGRSV